MLNLSRSQEIVWLHETLFPDSRAYNFTAELDLRGPLDEPALRRSLDTVLRRHDGLRLELDPTAFPPKQRVAVDTALPYRVVDLSRDTGAAYDRLWREHHDAPFDTSRAPLVRWTLVRLGHDHHKLLQTEHHLVHDGWSVALVMRDIFTTYRAVTRGVPAELPPATSYAEYLRRSLAAQDAPGQYRDALAYWRGVLAGADFDLALPGDLDRARIRDGLHGAQSRRSLEPELAERLRAAARRNGHTPFSVLLTLFAELLRRVSGQADLVIGSAVGNRPPEFAETVGMFVNTIPVRVELRPDGPGLTAADLVTEVLIRSLPHQHLPIQDLARELGVRSTTGLDNPLFRVMFSAHDAPLPEIADLDLRVLIHEGHNTGTSRFDLDVVLIPDSRRTVNPRTAPGGMLLIWDYAADMFGPQQIEELHESLVALLTDYLDDQDRRLIDLAPTVRPHPTPPAAAGPPPAPSRGNHD